MLAGATLTCCAAMQYPTNPADFREGVKQSSLGVVESFEARRPYSQVSETLRKKANECLAVTIETSGSVYQSSIGMWVNERSTSVYTPKVTVTQDLTELSLQLGDGKGNKNLFAKMPPDGLYMLVADAVSAGRNATRVTVYRGKWGLGKTVDAAIRGWATGEDMGCPELG